MKWTALLLATLLAATSASAETLSPCQGGTITLQAGSMIDHGWTGITHDVDLAAGASFDFVVVRRCTGDDSLCLTNTDCDGGECAATCDCDLDKSCEVQGPVQQKHCRDTLADCTSADDCPQSDQCVWMFGPPLPISQGGTPVCIVNHFEGPLTGTIDFATGEMSLAAGFVWRHFLGITLDKPCPRCGAPEESPTVGAQFTCDGGQKQGEACRVDAVTPIFGGTSFDCAPSLASNITGPGRTIRLNEITTGTTTRTAQLPCANFSFTRNPLNPATMPKCTDRATAEDPVCTSNADCTRCSGDSTVACATNDDCTDKGTCAEAPEQPVTCGFWCHCGFCGGDASLPCFQDSDCPEAQKCEVGPGNGTAQNAPQQKPNDCVTDGFLCGETADEECATTLLGHCTDAAYRNCTNNDQCVGGDLGACEFEPRQCFESRISRTGSPSALDQNDTATPQAAALFCLGGSSSSVINNVLGLTGPGALQWNTSLAVCRCTGDDPSCEAVCSYTPDCGDGIVDASSESCDDGNMKDGDGCSSFCHLQQKCGDADDDGEVVATDAQRILRSAVGVDVECPLSVCDVDASGVVLANDALRTLRHSVGLPAVLTCEYAT